MLILKLCIILLLFVIYEIFENKNLEITNYTIVSDKIPASFHDAKMVILADLHNNTYGLKNQKLLTKINQLRPDYILIAGDMVVSGKPEHYGEAFHLLSKLAKSYPIYYGLGNHEQRLSPGGECYHKKYEEYQEALTKIGVQFLENQKAVISKEKEQIAITGLAIGMEYYTKFKQLPMTLEYLKNSVGIPEKKCYNILIAHNPVYFKQYSEWGADLTLSGHLHGGIARLPLLGGVISPQYRLFPRYDAGRFDENGKTLLVSRGLGMHTIKLRFLNRPELMTVTLKHI